MMSVKAVLPMISLLLGCTFFSSNPPNKPKYQKICFRMNIPSTMPYSNGIVIDRPIRQNIIEGKGFILYEIDHYETFEDNGVLVKDTAYYDMFAYKEHDSIGYFVKSLADTSFKRVRVDSVVSVRTFNIIDAAKVINNLALSEPIFKDRFTMVRQFSVKSEDYDSVYYYYDKRLVHIRYSLSPTFDSIYQSKLCKMEMIVKKEKRPKDITGKDYNMHTLSLYSEPVENEAALDSFFTRLKAQY